MAKNNRQEELKELKKYIENIEKKTTLLLQNFQWDHKRLLEGPIMVTCKYDTSHRIPSETRETHEKNCYLALNGYSKMDVLLPDLIDPKAQTVVKFSKEDIKRIINSAALSDRSLRRAHGSPEPLSLERLQVAYTADERRAIYDAVVSAAPSCHDLTDLALVSSNDGGQSSKVKSRTEILAELRDMKRRRAKYRVAAKTTNYSDVLRDVIKTQMEMYSEAKGIFIKTEYGNKSFVSLHSHAAPCNRGTVPPPILIKQERISPEGDEQNSRSNYSKSSRRYRERSRSRDICYDKHRRKHDEREYKKRRHYEKADKYSSERRRYRDQSPEKNKYSSKYRRRNDESQLKREKYICKQEVCSSKDRFTFSESGNSYDNTQGWSAADSQRYKDNSNLYIKREKVSPDTRDDSDSREYDMYNRSHKDTYYNSKYEEYYKSSQDSDRYKERNHKRHHETLIKVEKDDDYEYSYVERKRRK